MDPEKLKAAQAYQDACEELNDLDLEVDLREMLNHVDSLHSSLQACMRAGIDTYQDIQDVLTLDTELQIHEL